MAEKWRAWLFYGCEVMFPTRAISASYNQVCMREYRSCYASLFLIDVNQLASFTTEIGALRSARRLALLPRVEFLVHYR